MSKITSKISFPIIVAGLFVITAFIAIYHENMGTSFYIILAILAVYLFSFGIATAQSLSSPIKKILNRATDLRRGDLSGKIYIETKDELSDLANVLNEIAQDLANSRLQEEKTQKILDIKVHARTQALEETIHALERKIKNRTVELERIIQESSNLQGNIKNKETETSQLQQEINDLKQRLSKYEKSKKAEAKAKAPVKNKTKEDV